jgi:hypothetical protein
MGRLDFTELPEVDFQVEEISGVPELPITGWVIHTREETVRLIGYITRGEGASRRRETTIILHIPLGGFAKSMSNAIAAWNRKYKTVNVH